ncbi:MAG: VCBS repeat-containing protein [Candidatus Hydrogenedentes bacterium]|nr:VCBS repeat-containing protein [Candidatus Hydrogenedentota bacterium]
MVILALGLASSAVASPPGSWLEPRQNPYLTAQQPMPGTMASAPRVVARHDLGRGWATIQNTKIGGEDVGLFVAAGALYSYDTSGTQRWKSHPVGLNFETIVRLADLDGDGKEEILLKAGRPATPYAAAVLVDLETGAVRWRYDVEPMSYSWNLYVGNYLPDQSGQQIFVVMMGYPPDPKNGYCALFSFGESGVPTERWRYDFSEYTCYPTFHQTDLDGNGVNELVIQTNSRAWFLDAQKGTLKDFAKWDVNPANVRSYGYTRFVDLDGDGREDFLCIANFSQHHEVLLNKNGTMEKAWHQGWAESVTTGKVVTTWPEPPYADVDGDGDLEIVVSMYNSENKGTWLTRIYDAVTGSLDYRFPGVIATQYVDLDEDGAAEILGNRSTDPTKVQLDGAVLLDVTGDSVIVAWEKKNVRALDHGAIVALGDGTFRRIIIGDNATVALATLPVVEPPPPGPDFSKVPALVGPALPVLLAGDLTGDGYQELILYQAPKITVLTVAPGKTTPWRSYESTSLPSLSDFNGDGRLNLALTHITPTTLPLVRVLTPSLDDKELWSTRFPEAMRTGLPQPRKAYTRTIHLTGKPTPDLYVWAGTPLVRSVGMDGETGAMLWEKGEASKERYWGPSVNDASAFDYNDDGKEDLVFTNPDYYCVADGPTGDLLLGPSFPPTIFDQPSQGLYTYPAILEGPGTVPEVCLVGGHYFQGGMSLKADPYWYKTPPPGENRSGREAFLTLPDGTWLMGFGRQNGRFACVDARTGALRWEFDVKATCSDVISGDVDGDGRNEFVFGTSHGEIIALGDDGDNAPRMVWRLKTGQSMGMPILADFDGDGQVELACAQANGWVTLWDGP